MVRTTSKKEDMSISSSISFPHIWLPQVLQTPTYIEDTDLRLMVLKEEAEVINCRMIVVVIDHHHATPKERNDMALK